MPLSPGSFQRGTSLEARAAEVLAIRDAAMEWIEWYQEVWRRRVSKRTALGKGGVS